MLREVLLLQETCLEGEYACSLDFLTVRFSSYIVLLFSPEVSTFCGKMVGTVVCLVLVS